MLNVRRKIDKLIAIEIIITMTLYYFLLVGKTAVSYAIDEVKTNHANVEFNAYFQNENGDKVGEKEASIDGEEYLYVEVSVKNEGYLNNGEIKISDNNFNIKEDKLSQEVAEIKDNTVKLNQLNAGSTATIKLAIEAKKENNIKESGLNGKTKIELGGEYINSKNVEKNKYVKIKGTAEVGMKWKSSEETKVELDGKLLTNSVYDVNGENKRLVQMLISSKVNNNSYPVKTNEITLNVPEKVEEVKVTARDTKGTNSKAEFGEGNYEYNKDEKRLTIKVSNEDTENISWEKEAEDMFVVTYVLNPNENIANEDIQVKDNMKLYDDREIEENKNVHIEEEIDGVVSSTIESSENEIYKGKIYTGEERNYTEMNKVNVDYVEADEKLEIDQKAATYIEGENEKEANIVYKETKIKKDEFQKIFGDDGYIEIQNGDGTVLQNINKDTEANEEGKIVITYPDGEKEIKLETSKAENIGTLEIENTKGIMSAGYGRDEIRGLTGIKEKVTVNGKVAEKVIGLKETETKANISLDVTKISTVAEKQEITVNATLEANDESKDLYKNPTVTIKLPKEIRVKTAQYAALYKNGLEIESTNLSTNGNGEAEIKLQFKGEQTKYDISGGTKICLKLEVEADKLTPSKASQIEMKYWNENKNEEKTETAGINFESQYGIMIYNQIQNYNNNGDTIVTIDKETAYGELGTNGEAKNLVLNTALINNYGEKVTDVTLIGKIPSDETQDGYVAKLKELQTNNDKVKITYSNKQDAEAGDDSWGEYREDVVSYKVVVDEMDEEEVIKLNVPVIIPENLKYNKKGNLASKVTYKFNGIEQNNNSSIVLETKSKIEKAAVIEKLDYQETSSNLQVGTVAISGNANLSNNDNVYEGQTIKYKVTITNNTGKDYTDVTVKAVQKNGYVWDWCEEERVNYYEGSEKIKENFYKLTNTNERNCGQIESLKNGESYTYEYEASTFHLNDEKIDGNKTYGTILITSEDGQLNDSVKTIENNITNSKYDIKLEQNFAREVRCTSNASISVNLKINNLSDSEQENLRLKIVCSNNLNFGDDDSEILNKTFLFRNDIGDRVSIIERKNGEDGKTILTLNISRIDANETLDMDVVPYTDDIQEKQTDVEMVAQIEEDSGDIYVSNNTTRTIYSNKNNMKVAQKILKNGIGEIDYDNDVIENGEILQIIGNVTNNKDTDTRCEISYQIDPSLEIQNAVLNDGSSDNDITEEFTGNGYLVSGKEIKSKETITITINAKVNCDKAQSKNALNTLSVSDNATYEVYSIDQNFLINKDESKIDDSEKGPVIDDSDIKETEDGIKDDENEPSVSDKDDNNKDDNNKDDNNKDDNNKDDNNKDDNNKDDNNKDNDNNSGDNSNNIGNNSGNDNSDSGDNSQNSKTYKVRGTVWVDEKNDGKMEPDEKKLSDIKVGAISNITGKVVLTTTTDSNGEYTLDLEEGTYIIIFFYDTNVYSVTTYKINGTTNDINSSAISKQMNIDGDNVEVGATDYIDVNSNIDNINIGLVKKNKLDLNISKYVSKISISNDLGNTIKEYNDTTLAKAEIKAKYLNGSTVVVEYKIQVTNQGNVAGYVKDIVDNKAKDLQFNSSINKDWYQSGDTLHTTSLSNTKIEPGETKELTLVLTKTMTESNTGLVNNTAQIASSSGENGAESTTNGKGSANVIISVSTGALISYVSITIIILTALGLGAYILNRKFLKA